MSDVDLIVVARESAFQRAWASRADLHGDDALVAWDDVDPRHAEIGAHKWLTRDLVLIECLLATPSSGVRLADPFELLVGDRTLPDELLRRPPFSRHDVKSFAAERQAAGRIHPVESAYAALVEAVRASRS